MEIERKKKQKDPFNSAVWWVGCSPMLKRGENGEKVTHLINPLPLVSE